MRLKTFLLSSFLQLLLLSNSFAVTNFNVSVKSSAGDYTSMVTAESALDEDLTLATIKVFSFSSNSGTIPDGTSVSTDGGSTTGVCVHQSVGGQILIKTIAGGTFDNGDVVTDGSHTVTLSTSGDSPIVKETVYNNQTMADQYSVSGGNGNSTNYLSIWGDTTNWNGTTSGAVKINVTSYSYSYWQVNQPYTQVHNLWIDTDNTPTYGLSLGDGGANTLIQDVIITKTGIVMLYSSNAKLVNVLVVGAKANGISNSSDIWGDIYLYNCTIINSATYGIYDNVADWKNQGIRPYNTVVYGSGVQDFKQNGQGTFQSADYVASGDNSAANCSESAMTYYKTGVVSGDFASLTTGFLSSSSALKDVGADYSAQGYTTDIVGTTRSGTWDIGADEYAATATRRIIFIN